MSVTPIRTLLFEATPAGVTPAGPIDAGVQGDHNATEVVFALEDSLNSTAYRYRFEYEDGAGCCDSSGALTPSADGIHWLLPLAWTRNGGIGLLRLVITLPGEQEDEQTVYTGAVRLRFAARSAGETQLAQVRPLLSSLLEQTTHLLDVEIFKPYVSTENLLADAEKCDKDFMYILWLGEDATLLSYGPTSMCLIGRGDVLRLRIADGAIQECKRIGNTMAGTVSSKDVENIMEVYLAEHPLSVEGAVAGHLVELDAKGNLTDSGVAAEDVGKVKSDITALWGVENFKPYSTTEEIVADAENCAAAYMYILWMGEDFTLLPYAETSFLMLSKGDIKRLHIANGTISGFNNVGNVIAGTVSPEDIQKIVDNYLTEHPLSVEGAVAGNLVSLDTDGNLADSGVATGDVVQKTQYASSRQIDERLNYPNLLITTSNLDYAIRKGLSSNSYVMTASEQQATCDFLKAQPIQQLEIITEASLGVYTCSLQPDRCYITAGNPVTSLTVERLDGPSILRNCTWELQFKAGSGITVTLPDGVVYAGAEPVYTAGRSYMLTFSRHYISNTYICAWAEV